MRGSLASGGSSCSGLLTDLAPTRAGLSGRRGLVLAIFSDAVGRRGRMDEWEVYPVEGCLFSLRIGAVSDVSASIGFVRPQPAQTPFPLAVSFCYERISYCKLDCKLILLRGSRVGRKPTHTGNPAGCLRARAAATYLSFSLFSFNSSSVRSPVLAFGPLQQLSARHMCSIRPKRIDDRSAKNTAHAQQNSRASPTPKNTSYGEAAISTSS